MDIYDRSYNAIKRISTNTNGAGSAITLINLEGGSCDIFGTKSKHHLGIDNQGNSVNTKNSHMSFHISETIRTNFNIRNSDGDIAIKGFKVILTHLGIVGNYVITEFYPSETTGYIVCILGEIDE